MSEYPLKDITIIDLTRVLAGPFATMLLADLGARVIKIEHPTTGDDARAIGPFVHGQSAYFASLNRGKESISLNLKTPAHQLLFEELLESADVLIDNFRPDFMPSLGYDWETLHARYPQLIVASITGFGAQGANKDKPAYDIIIQALSGMMSVTGRQGEGGVRVGVSIGDLAAGLFASNGILACLHKRTQTGKGARVDIAMLDCQIALLENAIARYMIDKKPPQAIGNRHPSITPFSSFKTQDRDIVIACGNDKLFTLLCEALAQPALAQDKRFATNQKRCEHHQELSDELEKILITRPASHWVHLLERAKIPVGLIRNLDEVCADKNLAARTMFVTSDDEAHITMSGNPIKISDCPDPPTRPPAPSLKKAP